MDFQTTILSRFDMMFLVKELVVLVYMIYIYIYIWELECPACLQDVRDPERDYKLAKHLVALHSGAQHEEACEFLNDYAVVSRQYCHGEHLT